jgi:hypothetical protein
VTYFLHISSLENKLYLSISEIVNILDNQNAPKYSAHCRHYFHAALGILIKATENISSIPYYNRRNNLLSDRVVELNATIKCQIIRRLHSFIYLSVCGSVKVICAFYIK